MSEELSALISQLVQTAKLFVREFAHDSELAALDLGRIDVPRELHRLNRAVQLANRADLSAHLRVSLTLFLV